MSSTAAISDDGQDSIGTAVLGAGPAGLTAAYVLALRGARGAVYEADGTVGGIAKTVVIVCELKASPASVRER